MMSDDLQQIQLLKKELQDMKVRYKDAIENKKLYEECLAKRAEDSEYLDLFKRLTCYWLEQEGF